MRDRSCSASALQRVLLFATLAVLFSSLSVAAAEILSRVPREKNVSKLSDEFGQYQILLSCALPALASRFSERTVSHLRMGSLVRGDREADALLEVRRETVRADR